jgi:hypothetical protein
MTISLVGLLIFGAVMAKADDDDAIKKEDLEKWGSATLVFTGTLAQVNPGPVGQSFPPMYTHQLEFDIQQVLRGADSQAGIQPGGSVTCSNMARQHVEPTFPEGKKCLVAADLSRGTWQVVRIEELTDQNLAGAKLALEAPIGWSIQGGEVVSPWAVLGEKAWPKGQDMNVTLLCSVTGRPVLMAGNAVLEVAPVPPKKEIKWTNPDGDGLYTVTVSNPTDQPLEVPALLRSDQGETLWADSLVIVCQGKTYPIPGAQGVLGEVESTVLQPGEKVSTVINALTLEGPEWPRGGQRVEFQFCLGEKSDIQSFYYMSKHHDSIRENAKPATPNNPATENKPTTENKRNETGGLSEDWSNKLTIAAKRNSGVIISENRGQVQLSIPNPEGIDTLTISCKEKTWPESIAVRLHTKGLESIRVSNGVETVSGEVPSHGNHAPFFEVSGEGKPAAPIDAASPHWLDLSRNPPDKDNPANTRPFEFKIPPALLTPDGDTLRIAWIDFYRN